MTKTKLVGRTAASVLGLIGLAMTADARANHQICPDCPSVNATIAYDSVASELYLDVDAFPSFDHGSVDTVELELTDEDARLRDEDRRDERHAGLLAAAAKDLRNDAVERERLELSLIHI